MSPSKHVKTYEDRMKPETKSARRCLLFVPANRPDRFEKAFSSGSDMVCIDLEDTVPIDQKEQSREDTISMIQKADYETQEIVLRINDIDTDTGRKDAEAIAASDIKPELVMLPKTSTIEQLELAKEILGEDQEIIPLIESPRGLINLNNIIPHSKSIAMLMFGGVDFTLEIQAQMTWDSLLVARSQMVITAAAHGLRVIDVPFLDVKNTQGLEEEMIRVKGLGFYTKAAVHPIQVDIIQRLFMPGKEEIESARKIVEAFKNTDTPGVVLVDGKMVDKPVLVQAQRLIKLVDRIENFS